MGIKRMAFWNKKKRNSGKTGSYWLINSDKAFENLCVNGYTRLDQIPAVISGCRKIAQLIGSLTIYLMSNTDNGDVRIKNELSRKIDIQPCETMNRSQFIEYIVMQMLLYGRGNSIVMVKTKKGLISDLQPIPSSRFSLIPDRTGYGYSVMIDGIAYSPDDVMHFVYNPDERYPWKGQGMTVPMQGVAQTLRQAQKTKKSFMESKWMPSVILKVDAIAEQFSDKNGRKKLIDEYIDTSEAGEPWVVPADQIDVTTVKPLSLQDLALNDAVAQDTKTVAALLGVPAFVLGAGDYTQKEWNNFVNSTIRPIAVSIQQEMTRKLILSPNWYLKFNQRGLYNYDLLTMVQAYTMLQDRGDTDGNECRDVIGLSPREGLDELMRLENYIPADMAALQSKLINSNGGNENE